MIIDETKLERIFVGNIPDIGKAEIFSYSNDDIKNIEVQLDGFDNGVEISIIQDEKTWYSVAKYLDEIFSYEQYSFWLVYNSTIIELERLKDTTIIFINNRITVEN